MNSYQNISLGMFIVAAGMLSGGGSAGSPWPAIFLAVGGVIFAAAAGKWE